MKIRYTKHHFGIQPGTVVDEPRTDVVAKLTATTFYTDDNGKRVDIKPIAVLADANEPTTEELELSEAKKKVQRIPAKPVEVTK